MKWRNSKLGVMKMLVLLAVFHTLVGCKQPKLKIIVPENYFGKIILVLSNVDRDILTVDSNGIGYITKHTFDKTYTKPFVIEKGGTDISNQAVGFNISAIWSKGKFAFANDENSPPNKAVEFLSFEVVPKDKQMKKQYYSKKLDDLIDKNKVLYR